jgi:hypothetical protein
MVQEIAKGQILTTEEIFRREHSTRSGARKVVDAPILFPTHASAPRSVDPIQVALTVTSAEMDMESNKAYRLVGSQDMHFRLSKGTSTALTTDIFLKAGEAIVIQSGTSWDKVSVIRAGTATADGIAQIVEMQ